MKFFYRNLQIGILGGGQLGRMLIQSSIDWNLSLHVLDSDPNAPCKFLTPHFKTGALNDMQTVLDFGKNLDLLTIEIEKVSTDALAILVQQGIKVFPQPDIIRTIQNKRTQKAFYQSHYIPTAHFVFTDDRASCAIHKHLLPCVWKSAYDGYDGKGVIKIHHAKDFEKIPNTLGFLEEMVAIKKEISVIVARNSSGQVNVFPPVELVYHPEQNLVDYLISPADINQTQEAEAKNLALKVSESFGIVGLLAVEMFIDKKDNLLVNEVAPRPHNSGHHTVEGNYTSQYVQHLRAILDLPLGNTAIKKPSAMINLLGAEGFEGLALYEGIENSFRTSRRICTSLRQKTNQAS